MTLESLYDVKTTTCSGILGGRCINCGNIEDSVICRNRVARPSLRNEPRGGTVENGVLSIL